MIKKTIGLLINLFWGFLTCPCLLIFITNIQGTAKGPAYTIPEVERDIYAIAGWMVLLVWTVIFICMEIAVFKYLFRKDRYMLCVGVMVFLVSAFLTWFLKVWS